MGDTIRAVAEHPFAALCVMAWAFGMVFAVGGAIVVAFAAREAAGEK